MAESKIAVTDDAAATVERIEREIRERFPKITRIYIESRNRIDLSAVAGAGELVAARIE